MPDDQPSPRELQRWLTGMQRDMNSRFDKLDQRLDRLVTTDTLKMVTERWDEQLRVIRKDITDLEQQREKDHATARAAKQWAIGMGVAMLGVAVAIFSIVVGKV